MLHKLYFVLLLTLSVGDIMAPVFAPLNVKLIARNVALGNNPCMPYDVCVRIFAGYDADIVHWEQVDIYVFFR